MSLQARIEVKVRSDENLQHYELINESHMHSGSATESHFKLTVVSGRFEGLGAVKRHQLMYALLAGELRDGVHALALHLYSPGEWRARQTAAPASPDCRGGSKNA